MIRQARLSDRQALAELAAAARGAPSPERRTLGLPAERRGGARLSLASLIPSWMPLRQSSLHLVLEEGGRIVGSCRAIEEPHGGEWVVVELDAAPRAMATEVRYELLSALVHEGGHRGVSRYHAACSAVSENLELFAQLDFVAYAAEEILYASRPAPRPPTDGQDRPDARVLKRVEPSDAWHLFHLWSRATPPLVARAEGYSAADWESADRSASVPRSSLTSLLRFSDVRGWLLPDGLGAAAFVQHASSRDGPHYLRLLVDDETEPRWVLGAGLEAAGLASRSAGVLTAVRTYEGRVVTALTDAGFEAIGSVSLLVRDVRARIKQPALVPAIQ